MQADNVISLRELLKRLYKEPEDQTKADILEQVLGRVDVHIINREGVTILCEFLEEGQYAFHLLHVLHISVTMNLAGEVDIVYTSLKGGSGLQNRDAHNRLWKAMQSIHDHTTLVPIPDEVTRAVNASWKSFKAKLANLL